MERARTTAALAKMVTVIKEASRRGWKKVGWQYCVSTLMFAIALVLNVLLWPLIEPAASTLFFAAIMVAAFYGGLGTGLLVSSLSTLAIDYYFIAPFYGFEISFANVVRAGVFMLVATMTSWLNASRKRLMEDIRVRDFERERLLTQISRFNDELREEIAIATKELSTVNDSLLQTQQRLARSERMAVVGQLAACLAHEIGTPLNAISGHMELIATNHPDDTDTQRRIRIISRQLDFIVATVKRLLEQTHERAIFFQPVDLNALVKEVLTLVGPALDKHSISHDVTFQAHLPCFYADPDGLQQVLLNLINNSVDAMANGGHLTIITGLNSPFVEIAISDTGSGIDQSMMDHLFEPMWTTKRSGSGFGLAIAHQVISDHKGEIKVLTGAKQGTTFLLKLPLRSCDRVDLGQSEVSINVAGAS
jgi:signal transduction histidine kinase